MRIFILLLMMILASCAHKAGLREVSESNLDGLRFESLNRYDSDRLLAITKENKTIAMCHKGLYNEAIEEFKLQLDAQKTNPKYWNHLATCYLLNTKLSQAKFYFDLALKTVGNDKTMESIIHNNIGIYYTKLKQDDLALSEFNKSITLSKKYLTPQYNMAQIYLKFGLYNKAKNILNLLISRNPKDIDFINSIGHLNLMTGQYKKALYFYSQIPQKYMHRDDYATNYSMALYMSGKYKEALKVIKSADMDEPHYQLAQTELIKNIEKNLK